MTYDPQRFSDFKERRRAAYHDAHPEATPRHEYAEPDLPETVPMIVAVVTHAGAKPFIPADQPVRWVVPDMAQDAVVQERIG